jgi:hypothetical protein
MGNIILQDVDPAKPPARKIPIELSLSASSIFDDLSEGIILSAYVQVSYPPKKKNVKGTSRDRVPVRPVNNPFGPFDFKISAIAVIGDFPL